jgi:hypothetical protein
MLGSSFYYVGFEVLTAMIMKSSIFWNVTPSSPLKVNLHSGGTCHFHLQGRRISQARNQQSFACTCLHADFLLGLFFSSEGGGDMFL